MQVAPDKLRNVILDSLTTANAARAAHGRSHTDDAALREMANNLAQVLCLSYEITE